MFGDIEEIVDQVESKFNRFKNFDTIDHPPRDHHYYKMFDLFKFIKHSGSSSVQTRIERDLSRLEENIPDWVYVRSYKHRIDLMRAAVIGPPNSPYHNCLFFFDIEFPRNYPSKPPKVHYRSHGIHLNLNLRSLSEAKYEESNLLNIFHAIRDALLITESKNNRRVFVLACQEMMKVMREPPAGFREFVFGHFRKRAHSVLMRFREDQYLCDSVVMVDLFVKMFKVFERNGTYCKHHIGILRSRENRAGIDFEAKIRELESTQIDNATTSTHDQDQEQGRFDTMWSFGYF